ncbi:MAG: ATP-binding protein [Bacteroidota bacterium]
MKSEKNSKNSWKYKYIKSTNFLKIQKLCEQAQKHHLFCFIVGHSGLGKSHGFSNYIINNEFAHWREVDPSLAATAFYRKIISDFEGYQINEKESLNYFITLAAHHLTRAAQHNLFIIDEAGNFKKGMLKYLREFRDKTEKRSGLIISGPPSFYNDFNQWHRDEVRGIEEMMTRIDEYLFLEPPSYDEKKALCHINCLTDSTLVNQIAEECDNFRSIRKRIEKYHR